MTVRFDSPLAKALGLCFAVLALVAVVLPQSLGLDVGTAFGANPVGTALGIVAVVAVAVLWIATDNAFED